MIRPLDDQPPERRIPGAEAASDAGVGPHAEPRSSSDGAGTCPICGNRLYGAHCKLICNNCGYREDCSDLFPEC